MRSQHLAEEDMLPFVHEHYKDTFSNLQKRETERNRLYLALLALFALLITELRYAAMLTNVLPELGIAGTKLNLSKVPIPVMVTFTWTITLVLLIRYYQSAIWVVSQYDYVHSLESRLSILSGENVGREGTAYNRQTGSALRNASWYFYIGGFPIIALACSTSSIYYEWRLIGAGYFQVWDSAMCLLILLYTLLYCLAQWQHSRSDQ